jgi:hypothetical protein
VGDGGEKPKPADGEPEGKVRCGEEAEADEAEGSGGSGWRMSRHLPSAEPAEAAEEAEEAEEAEAEAAAEEMEGSGAGAAEHEPLGSGVSACPIALVRVTIRGDCRERGLEEEEEGAEAPAASNRTSVMVLCVVCAANSNEW